MDLVPQVILLRAEGKTLQDIASLMNLSKQRISQVIQVAKRHEAIQARWVARSSRRSSGTSS